MKDKELKHLEKMEEMDEPVEKVEQNSEEQNLDFYLETIENLHKERDEYHDLLLRKQAEFENYRKRVTREKEQDRSDARAEVLTALLPVIDAGEKGLDSMLDEEDPKLESYRHGYVLLLQEVKAVLQRFGVAEIPAEGQPFDPNVHEAVIRDETHEHPDGIILEEYRRGYRIGEKLLRPSQVKVAVNPTPKDEVSN